MSNLAQFNQRPEEFVQYLKDEKGVNIGGDSDIVKILLVLCGLMFAGFGGWWLYDHYKNEKDSVEDKTFFQNTRQSMPLSN